MCKQDVTIHWTGIHLKHVKSLHKPLQCVQNANTCLYLCGSHQVYCLTYELYVQLKQFISWSVKWDKINCPGLFMPAILFTYDGCIIVHVLTIQLSCENWLWDICCSEVFGKNKTANSSSRRQYNNTKTSIAWTKTIMGYHGTCKATITLIKVSLHIIVDIHTHNFINDFLPKDKITGATVLN